MHNRIWITATPRTGGVFLRYNGFMYYAFFNKKNSRLADLLNLQFLISGEQGDCDRWETVELTSLMI